MPSIPAPLLELRRFSVRFRAGGDSIEAVAGVTLTVARGECIGIVGESGAGKSQLLLAPFRLAASRTEVGGEATLAGQDLLALEERALDRIRGAHVGFVFQDPMSTLTPHRTIGAQLAEVLEHHGRARGASARASAQALLARAGIDAPARRIGQYPHELSGGQRQRVAIALALACEPELLIADEPTTALDVTVQAGILAMLDGEKHTGRLAIALVSHDFGVVSRLAERVYVMYAGRIVEQGPTDVLTRSPAHPYTAALLACIPRMDDALEMPLEAIPGQPPDPRALPTGCAFHPRCPRADERCRTEVPVLAPGGARAVACHHPLRS
ncbi:MAG: ABC transporter ATP-binding protein [Steroidobacteraceae bacterium]